MNEHTIFLISDDDRTRSGNIKCEKLLIPILKLIAEGHSTRSDIWSLLEQRMSLSPVDLAIHISHPHGEELPTRYTQFQYISLWSFYFLRKAKLIKDVGRGIFNITESGMNFLRANNLETTDSILPSVELELESKITSFQTAETKPSDSSTELDIVTEDIPSTVKDEDRYEVYCKQGRITFVTFHPSFGYEEFVEGLTAKSNKDNVIYEIREGTFKKCCRKAIWFGIKDYIGTSQDMDEQLQDFLNDAQDKYVDEFLSRTDRSLRKKVFVNAPKCVIIIDEINRGNISKILGELITLIEPDKRLGEDNELIVTLPASEEKFGVPPNLFIIGTMNSSDRSLTNLDIALRRRFYFEELIPDEKLIEQLNPEGYNTLKADVDLVALMTLLNKRIEILLDKDHKLGHSEFLKVKNKEDLCYLWNHKIMPLLEEYFYGDVDKMKALLSIDNGERTEFLEKLTSAEIKKCLGNNTEEEERWVIKRFSEEKSGELLTALGNLAIQAENW